MPYPMAKMPTVREFIDIAEREFGAELVEQVRPDPGPNEPAVFRYLVRIVESKRLRSYTPLREDDYRMLPSELRHHCSAVEIPLTHFGLNLEDPDWW